MKRRLFLGAASGAGAMAAIGRAAAQAMPIKIGFIASFSGVGASLGDMMDKSIRLYIKQNEKTLPPGVTIEIIRRDDGGPNPDVTKRLATELVTRDKVQFLTGLIYTPNAMAVAEVATEAKVPTIIMKVPPWTGKACATAGARYWLQSTRKWVNLSRPARIGNNAKPTRRMVYA